MKTSRYLLFFSVTVSIKTMRNTYWPKGPVYASHGLECLFR